MTEPRTDYSPSLDELAADIADQLANRAPFFNVGAFTRVGEFGPVTLPGRASTEVGGNRLFVTFEHPFNGSKFEFTCEVRAVRRG